MDTGSPVIARQDSSLYSLIIIIIVGVVVLSSIGIVLLRIREKHRSKSWIDSHKDLPTTKKNVKAITKIANLTFEESTLLWEICRRFKAKNIEYLYKDYEAINDLFREEYKNLCQKNEKEEKKELFFSLRYKLEKAHDIAMFIKSSTNIQEGQVISLQDKEGTPWQLEIVSNSKQGFYVELPQILSNSQNKPTPLEKINIQFSTKTNISYTLETRVVRYEIGKDGKELMFCSQTNLLKPLQRRMSKRMDVDMPCKFSAVKGDVRKKNNLTVLDNRYDGVMNDISPTGCSLTCKLPIKHGQLIYVEFKLDNETVTTIGEIVATHKIPNKKAYILHIKYIEIQKRLQNDIYASIYGYKD